MKEIAFVMVLSLALLSTAALAEVPGLMSYQGTLTDDQGVALDTTVSMTFEIYADSTGGTYIWKETQLAVAVSNGIFNVLLGSATGIPDSVFNDPERWLGVQVGGDPDLTPRQRIAAVGYAFEAAEADTADYARSAPAASDGDWTISGNNMYSAVPGSVGIGMATPLAHLHLGSDVNTELRIEHGDWKNTIAFYRHGDPAGYIVKDDDTRRLRISAGDSTDHVTIVETDGHVGIGTITPAARLDVRGTLQVGVNTDGHDVNFYGDLDGSRFFWDDSLMALRAGLDSDGTHWDPDSIGQNSVALGYNAKATGSYSAALGCLTAADGVGATALGYYAKAIGYYSTALGYNPTADGTGATAMGGYTTAGGSYSTAMGWFTEASGDKAAALGERATASGDGSLAIGKWVTADTTNAMVLGLGVDNTSRLVNNIPYSLIVGFDDTEPTLFVGGPNHRVGIGTATPSVKLDVDGAVNADSVYQIGGNTVLSASGWLIWNTFVGMGAGESNTGTRSTFLGYRAGRNNQSWDNTFVGAFAGSSNTSGSVNTFIGEQAGESNTTGQENTFLGSATGHDNTDGSFNTCLGAGAGTRNTTGIQNTYVGTHAGYSNITGSRNVFIGRSAGYGETGSDLLHISNTSLYTLIWGDFNGHTVVIDGDSTDNINERTFFVDGDAGGNTAWYNDSDAHLKENIRTIPRALRKVQELRGVNFKWKDTEKHAPGRQMGFVAQEAVKVIPEVVSGEDGHYAMQYGPISALLVEAIKEQQGIIEELKARIETLETANRPE